MPIFLTSESLSGIHGIDEHVSVEALEKMVQFFGALIQAYDRML
jgi:acetylornithine deacetylase/succinyl-diaminopimelate desuccinylase-like protein